MSAIAVQARPSGPMGGREQHWRHHDFAGDGADFHKVPAPAYRHATPSTPWPWMKFDIDASEVHPITAGLPGNFEWSQYPQSLFENWTHEQVNRSQMLTKCSDRELSTMYKLNVFNDGTFEDQREVRTVRRTDAVDQRAYWNYLGMPSPLDVRVQVLFVEDMTPPVLQMLGTRYNIEPFFFASSANWIPSRYQEDATALEDHITVVLPFIRTLKNRRPITRTQRLPARLPTMISTESMEEPLPYTEEKNQIFDTQVPLSISDNKTLFQDLLSLHMIRNTTTSTIISCHPGSQFQATSARRLQSLVQRIGDSVYWSKVFGRSKDPTFLFLAILWYALYAWDEAFEVLFSYINTLETDVLRLNDIKLTRELHKLQAHILYYQQLLRDFRRSVEFVRDTPNPAMSAPSISNLERGDSAKLLHTEANTLISEIERVSRRREMLSDRLDNVIHLTFATVNIEESKALQVLAEAAMKNSCAIKQMGYLSMVFPPAIFLANVFSTNITAVNPRTTGSLAHFIEAVVGLTLFTSWLVIALQKDSSFYPSDSGVFQRILWPLFYTNRVMSTEIRKWLRPGTDSDSQPASD